MEHYSKILKNGSGGDNKSKEETFQKEINVDSKRSIKYDPNLKSWLIVTKKNWIWLNQSFYFLISQHLIIL